VIRPLADPEPKTFVFDLDGVVYLGGVEIPGAGATLAGLRDDGHQILFATNNSSRSVSTVLDSIAERTGFLPDPGSVITSGMAAANLIAGGDERCIVLGSAELEDTLVEAGITITANPSEATVLVVGLDRRLSYERLTAAVLAVNHGARFVATNSDPTFPMLDGRYPGGGAIVAAGERATGMTPTICGKPFEPMRVLVERKIVNDDVWMIGDRADTDLALAATAGWGKILVLTGVTGADDVLPADLVPDHVIESIADLPPLLTRQSSHAER